MNGKNSVRKLSVFRSTFSTLRAHRCNLRSSYNTSSSAANFITFLDERGAFHLLRKCQNMNHLCQLQAHFITGGIFQNPVLATRLLSLSSDFGDIAWTFLIFRSIDSPDTFCVNTVIKVCSRSRLPHQAVLFYTEILRNGFSPNSYTFPPLFSSCRKTGCAESGQQFHGHVIKNGVGSVLPVRNSLISMYGCLGFIDFARKVFDEMGERDVVSWNSVVDAFVNSGYLGIAHKLFDALPERNVVSWNIMIAGYFSSNNPGCSLKLFREMIKTGLRGSDTTMVSVISACGRSARLKEGRSIHGSLFRTFPLSSLIIDTALIDMYSKCNKVETAGRVFDRMSERNLVCWNAMILGHCIHGNPKDGLSLFAEMVKSESRENTKRSLKPKERQERIIPDEVTLIGILCACVRTGMLHEGRNFFIQMINDFNISPNFAHYWCISNLFVGAGLVDDAEELLRIPFGSEDVSPESLVWVGLLASCRFQGAVALGERIASSLVELKPHDFWSYALLLNVYAVAGQWEDVAKVKMKMKESRVGRMPGCSLANLKGIVHELKV